MTSPSDRVEAECPCCGTTFSHSLSIRSKRVQCPHCRKVITLAAPSAAPAPSLPSVEEYALLQCRVAEQATQIQQLLAAQAATPLATKAPAPLPPLAAPLPGDSLLCPGQTLRWLRRDPHCWAAAEEDAEQRDILLHNLRAMGGRNLVLQAGLDEESEERAETFRPNLLLGGAAPPAGLENLAWSRPPASPTRLGEGHDPSRREHLSSTALVDRLSAVFRAAGWTVREPDAHTARPPTRGLILAAGQCPMPQAATAIYMALQAAGLPVVPRLDDSLGPEESVLIAGSACRGHC